MNSVLESWAQKKNPFTRKRMHFTHPFEARKDADAYARKEGGKVTVRAGHWVVEKKLKESHDLSESVTWNPSVRHDATGVIMRSGGDNNGNIHIHAEHPSGKKYKAKFEGSSEVDVDEFMHTAKVHPEHTHAVHQAFKHAESRGWGMNESEELSEAAELRRAKDVIAKYDRNPGGHKDYAHVGEVKRALKVIEKYKDLDRRAANFEKHITKEDLDEKWGTEVNTPKNKQGMWDGYSLEDLHAELAKAKAGKPHKGTEKEIEFAIRAKTGWGKVSEDEEPKRTRMLHRIRKKYLPNQEPVVPNSDVKPVGWGESEELDEAKNKSKEYSPRGMKYDEKAAEKRKKKEKERIERGEEAPRNTREDGEEVYEHLTADMPMSAWIKDFEKSKNPKFAGKDKKERARMAMGAYYSKKNESLDEDVKQLKKAGYKYTGKGSGRGSDWQYYDHPDGRRVIVDRPATGKPRLSHYKKDEKGEYQFMTKKKLSESELVDIEQEITQELLTEAHHDVEQVEYRKVHHLAMSRYHGEMRRHAENMLDHHNDMHWNLSKLHRKYGNQGPFGNRDLKAEMGEHVAKANYWGAREAFHAHKENRHEKAWEAGHNVKMKMMDAPAVATNAVHESFDTAKALKNRIKNKK